MIGTFIGGLETVFAWVLEASWQATVVAALVLSVQWALRGRLNPRWHHALWLLVVNPVKSVLARLTQLGYISPGEAIAVTPSINSDVLLECIFLAI